MKTGTVMSISRQEPKTETESVLEREITRNANPMGSRRPSSLYVLTDKRPQAKLRIPALGLLAGEGAFTGRRGDDRIRQANCGVGESGQDRADQRRDNEEP